MTLNEAFDTLADGETWESAAAVMAGFLAPTVARNLFEPNVGVDLPDEVYGLLVVVGGQYSPMYGSHVSLGGAVYSVETLQHLHPDAEAALDDVARVAGELLVTVENEEGTEGADAPDDADVNYVDDEFPLYYRDWGAVFTERGMVEAATERGKRTTRRVFRRPGHSSSRL
jgi:hypothetical protein